MATLHDTPLTKQGLQAWVVGLKQRGLTNGGINMYARTINSYLSWLYEEEHLGERLRVKLLKNPLKPIDLLTDADIKRLLLFKPKGRNQTRAWTLIVTLLDTGLRIDEALKLEQGNVNMDALTVRVVGKGNKERLVPISIDLRKHLWRWLQKAETKWVFGARRGTEPENYSRTDDGLSLLRQPALRARDHLFLGTSQDNSADMVAKGRSVLCNKPGQENSNARLSDAQVREIRERWQHATKR